MNDVTVESIKAEIERKIWDLKVAQDDARNDVPIKEDEHYESDEYYEGAIWALEMILDLNFRSAKECNGSRYDSPKDGKHLWVHPNFDKPAVCYYCSAKEGEGK
jgi:hypothetical protein